MVEERLAACVNILGPIRSIYRWQGKIEKADGSRGPVQVHRRRADALITRIAELHSYEVPCIETWPVDKLLRELCRLGRR